MKKKVARKVAAGKKPARAFGGTELLLLTCVTLALLVLFAWQTGTLPGFLVK